MPWKLYSPNSHRDWPEHQLYGVTSILGVVGDDGKWKATLILCSLGKYLYLNRTESPHFYPIGSPVNPKSFLWALRKVRGKSRGCDEIRNTRINILNKVKVLSLEFIQCCKPKGLYQCPNHLKLFSVLKSKCKEGLGVRDSRYFMFTSHRDPTNSSTTPCKLQNSWGLGQTKTKDYNSQKSIPCTHQPTY